MARFFYQQNSFQSGQVTPLLYGRTDIEEYRKGLTKLENFDILPTGGVSKRKGIQRVQSYEVDEKAKTVHIPLVDYRSSNPNRVLRIYYGTSPTIFIDGEEVAVNPTFANYARTPDGSVYDLPADIIAAAAVDPYGFHYTQIGVYLVVTHISGVLEPFVVSPTISYTVFGSPTYAIFRVMTDRPRTASALSHVYTDNPWAINQLFKAAIYEPNRSTVTLAVSGITVGTNVTLTASSAMFTPNYVNTIFLLDDKAVTPSILSCIVLSTTGTEAAPSTTASVRVIASNSGFPTTATDLWYESEWSKANGYPTTLTFFENRLLFGGTANAPTKIWGSATNAAGIMSPRNVLSTSSTGTYQRDLSATPNAALPYSFEMSAGQGESLSWLSSTRNLLCGTNEREIVLDGGDSPISSTNFPQVRVIGTTGSSAVRPFTHRDSVFSVGRSGDSIIESKFSSENGQYIAQRVTRISDIFEINEEIIKRIEIVAATSIGYALCLSGNLYTFTMSEFGNEVGFAKLVHDSDISIYDIVPYRRVGANFPENLNVFYNVTGSDDDLSGKIFEKTITPVAFDVNDDVYFLDHSTLANNPLDLDVIAGSFIPDKTYTVITSDGTVITGTANGAGTQLLLPQEFPLFSEFIVGLPYTARLETLDLAVGPNFLYSASGDEFRIDTVDLDLFRSHALDYGSVSDGEEILYPLEVTAPPAFSGRVKVNLPMSSGNATRVVVQSNSPFNVTVTSLTMRGKNTQVS